MKSVECPECKTVISLEIKCKRCGCKFTPRKQNPSICPYCKSTKYDVVPKKSGAYPCSRTCEKKHSQACGNCVDGSNYL